MADAITAPQKKVLVKVEFGDTTEEVEDGSKEHLVLSQDFDTQKKYMFELALENPIRENPVIEVTGQKARPAQHKKFKPWHNIVLTSQIVWKSNRRMIRYYDGCTTIFIDKQPKEKDLIEQLISQTNKDRFILRDGKVGFYGEDKMALLYLNICSWNVDSPFRTRTADGIFKAVNADVLATTESAKLDETETALELAKEASEIKMRIHANYLGIPTVDWDSGNELTDKEIRTAYRKEALRNSSAFITSYGNKSIEVRFYVDRALAKGIISNKLNPNKASWTSSGREICDISGLRSTEAIAQRLYEFSQTEDGEEFLIQLKVVSE